MKIEENKTQILSGIVIFKNANAGSKSESLQPFLKTEKGEEIHLYKMNSNPFENNDFHTCEGKTIEATGVIKDGTLHVSDYEIQG